MAEQHSGSAHEHPDAGRGFCLQPIEMKPSIAPSFWSDADIENQPAEVKLCALWLLTNSQTSLIGVCSATAKRFHFETGLSPEWLEKACDALPDMFTRFGEVIFARNFIRHQFGTGEKLMKNNIFSSIAAAFGKVKCAELQEALISEYPELAPHKGLQSPSKGLVKPKEKEKEEGESNKEKEKEKERAREPEGFEDFWQAYPRKAGKGDAEKAWIKLKLAPKLPEILTSIRAAKVSLDWTKEAGQYIPHPATWLNRRGWEDQLQPARPPTSAGLDKSRTIPLKPSEQPPIWRP
jgi:hypothetical protein